MPDQKTTRKKENSQPGLLQALGAPAPPVKIEQVASQRNILEISEKINYKHY